VTRELSLFLLAVPVIFGMSSGVRVERSCVLSSVIALIVRCHMIKAVSALVYNMCKGRTALLLVRSCALD
jgi:hypothetical protein